MVRGVDGHDPAAIDAAIREALAVADRPSLLCCKTIIGFGAPSKAGKASAHGAPLGDDEIAGRAREALGWPHPPFEIPGDIYAGWDARRNAAPRAAGEWQARLEAWRARSPTGRGGVRAADVGRSAGGLDVESCARHVEAAQAAAENIASRKASQNALEALGPMLPELIGGSADLTGSNLTKWSGSRVLTREDADANYVYFGVREFAMNADRNGIALHGGFIPYTGTFLMFSEYGRNALRMAALMGQRVISVFTHDSIGLGEDGPTHQAVEQTATLRLMPNMSVWRPCDAVESMVAWQAAIERRGGPTSLLFSRQGLPHQEPRTPEQVAAIARGGYVLREGGDAMLIATGSEVGIAMDAAALLAERGVEARVVSMPSTRRVRGAGRRHIALRCSRARCGRASRWRPGSPPAGAPGSARTERSRGSTRSGSRRRTSTCTSTSA